MCLFCRMYDNYYSDGMRRFRGLMLTHNAITFQHAPIHNKAMVNIELNDELTDYRYW